MSVILIVLISKCRFHAKKIVFLISSNVKIPSHLERSKMKLAELFSKNGDSVRIF